MFALPRSSWDDYDRGEISAGGGVWARSAKSVTVSPQAAARLGLDPAPEALTPDELVRAILLAPVDMIWNGGIGTFVKATSEDNAAAGDKANDGVRVDAADLRARVVVEGGNLGLTQLGRIEFAMAGGKVNTDAIDNSAGVDASDHEVNIKIALDRAVAAGELGSEGRNDLLREMTDEVAALVLRDNYEQNVALANAAAQAPSLLNVHARYIRRLVAEGRLDRAVEFLPSDRVIAERRQAGLGLVVPELAVLMAFVKNELAADLVASDLPDDPESLGELLGYFPAPVRTRFGDRIEEHPLRREIVATRIANRVVNRAGTTFVERQREELGAGSAAIARAHGAAWAVYDMEEHWRAIEEMDPRMAPQVQTDMRLEGRRLVDRGAGWMLRHRPGAGLVEVIGEMAEPVRRAVRLLPATLRGAERAAHDERLAALLEAGVPADLAAASARMPAASAALDIVDVALRTGRAVEEVAGVYHDLSDRLVLARLRARIDALPRDDRWHTLARSALRQELLASQAAITAAVLAHGGPGAAPENRVAAWSRAHDAAVARTRATLDAIGEDGVFDFATLSVATRAVRELA
jgi:glutamate dehydrogenase